MSQIYFVPVDPRNEKFCARLRPKHEILIDNNTTVIDIAIL